ncbi:unnamed protein product [Effrenium voratum]|nr:unnamed protein product [Effrenium voratum]
MSSAPDLHAAVASVVSCLEGCHARVSQQDILREFGASKAEARSILATAATFGGEGRSFSLDFVAVTDLADGSREVRLIPEETTGRREVEEYAIRKSSISAQDAATLQWRADLETYWERYKEPVTQNREVSVVVDLSDGEDECRMLDS